MPKMKEETIIGRRLKKIEALQRQYDEALELMASKYIFFTHCQTKLKFEDDKETLLKNLKIIKKQIESAKTWSRISEKHLEVVYTFTSVGRSVFKFIRKSYDYQSLKQVNEDVNSL